MCLSAISSSHTAKGEKEGARGAVSRQAGRQTGSETSLGLDLPRLASSSTSALHCLRPIHKWRYYPLQYSTLCVLTRCSLSIYMRPQPLFGNPSVRVRELQQIGRCNNGYCTVMLMPRLAELRLSNFFWGERDSADRCRCWCW